MTPTTRPTTTRTRPNTGTPPMAMIGLLSLVGLALLLVPGLEAAAVDAVKSPSPFEVKSPLAIVQSAPLLDGFKLLLAAVIGWTITSGQARTRRDQPLTRSMAQSYVLLCVAGALTMAMIGDSLPRAFGVAGAASIVKFRTPIDDPRDGTALFLLMGLGMACGVGSYGIAIIGTLFLAGCLVVLSRQAGGEMPRSMRVAVIADSASFPAQHIARVFSNHHITAEALEISHGERTIIRYKAVLNGHRELELVSQQLLENEGSGIKSVSWEAPKRWV